MKKLLLSILIITLIIPNVALAKWWNPGTWFKKDPAQVEEIKKEPPVTAESEKKANTANALNADEKKGSSSIPPDNSKAELQLAKKEIQNKNTEIASLKKTLADLQKNLTPANSQCKSATENIVYKDRVVEKPIEKIVYQDRVVERIVEKIVYRDRQVSCDLPATQTQAPTTQLEPVASNYSDYSFNYKWEQNSILSCPTTFRSIIVKKAVFKLPESEAQKINTLRSLESDGFKIYMPNPRLASLSAVNQASNSTFTLEDRGQNTYVYLGGIPICGDGGRLSITYGGVLSDTTSGGRNIASYLAQKGLSIQVSSGTGGDPSVTPGSSNATFVIQLTPVMSEWEVFDNTTGKPVKI